MTKNEATKKEMHAEALLRMRLLKLSDETIKAFEEDNQVMVSDQFSMEEIRTVMTVQMKSEPGIFILHIKELFGLFIRVLQQKNDCNWLKKRKKNSMFLCIISIGVRLMKK